MADDRMVTRLFEPVQAHKAIKTAWRHAKGWLCAGGARLVLEVRPETRSDRQNRLLHALFGDVAKQALWMGASRTPEQWKLLFVSGHAIATKEGADMVPGLEGEFLNLRESTARMSKARMASLLEYVISWGIDHGIEFRESSQWMDETEKGGINAKASCGI